MLRRALAVAGTVLLLLPLGCQTQLPKVWSFSGVRSHAERIDKEAGWFYADFNAIFFGIDDYEPKVTWTHYDD